MSSHHFVREGQEPAFFIVDALSFDIASPLLEWAPLVIVSAQALDDVLMWGIKIDAVVTRNADEALVEKLLFQRPLEILECRPDENFMDVGINFLRLRNGQAVNVMGDVLIEEFAPANTQLDLSCMLINRDIQWSLVRRGHLEKWMTVDSSFRIFSCYPDTVLVDGPAKNHGDGTYQALQTGLFKLSSKHEFWFGETS